jgi:hypothetical protein
MLGPRRGLAPGFDVKSRLMRANAISCLRAPKAITDLSRRRLRGRAQRFERIAGVVTMTSVHRIAQL